MSPFAVSVCGLCRPRAVKRSVGDYPGPDKGSARPPGLPPAKSGRGDPSIGAKTTVGSLKLRVVVLVVPDGGWRWAGGGRRQAVQHCGDGGSKVEGGREAGLCSPTPTACSVPTASLGPLAVASSSHGRRLVGCYRRADS